MGAAHAVGTAAAHDDDTILTRTGFRRGNGLGALIQVLVQRVAAVAGDHDIAGNAGALAPFADKGNAFGVSLFQVACPGGDDLFWPSSATLKMNWTLTILAAASISSWMGLCSSTPVLAYGLEMAL